MSDHQTALMLLQELCINGPGTPSELAEKVKKKPRTVRETLQLMASLGLTKIVGTTHGSTPQAPRPYLWDIGETVKFGVTMRQAKPREE